MFADLPRVNLVRSVNFATFKMRILWSMQVPQPAGIQLKMSDYQLQGLAWLQVSR